MKGFFIHVTNELLDPKHRKNMGTAVWEFMWCLDKITRVDKGIGYVSGGAPVNLGDIRKDLGIDENHISENLGKLESCGYISKTRTPYGLVIRVNKAKKRFNQKVESHDEKVDSPSKKVDSNKTLTVDNTEDKELRESTPADSASEFFSQNSRQETAVRYLVAEKSVPEALARAEVAKFVSYWTEPNRSGTRERWEAERFFHVGRRLATWFSRIGNFQRPAQTRQKGIEL